MPLPASPVDGQTATLRGITYTYSSASDSWSISTLYSNTAAFTTLNGNLQAPGATFTGNTAVKVPVGNTSQRPTAATGQLRFNSDLNVFEGYNGTIWGSIGGGAKIQDTPPSNPIVGDLWWKSDEGQLYIYYSDGDSSQWVVTSSFAGTSGNVTINSNGGGGGEGSYLPLTGGTVTGAVNLATISGNVGIGNTSPTHKLSVTGTMNVSGNANLGNLGTGALISSTLSVSGNANVGNIGSGGIVNDSKGDVRLVPQNTKTTAYALIASDSGKHISTNSNVTVPNSVFVAGDTVTILNNGTANITIIQDTSVTMYQVGTATTGNRTLAQKGLATVICYAANTFVITGGGLS